jgi:hypothetical protein
MPSSLAAAADLYWIPLGAGGPSVRFNGRVFETVEALREHRERYELFHAALVVTMRDIPRLKAEFFKALGHPLRIRVLELLAEGEQSVSALDMVSATHDELRHA